MFDHIADLIAKLNNAKNTRLPSIKVQTTKMTTAILQILVDEGYISSFATNNIKGTSKQITIANLKYKHRISVINGLKQISKPGLRQYCSCNNLPNVLNGLGIAIISTNQGIMTNKSARKSHLGGEIIAHIW